MDIWATIAEDWASLPALAASGRGARIYSVTGPGQPALAAWLRR